MPAISHLNGLGSALGGSLDNADRGENRDPGSATHSRRNQLTLEMRLENGLLNRRLDALRRQTRTRGESP
jgi:hypothetical protein